MSCVIRNSRKQARIVSIRGPFGELVSVLRMRSTDQFTENAERFASRRFCVSAFHATICVGLSRPPRLSISTETNRGPRGTLRVPSAPRNLAPKLSESLVNRGLGVNNAVPFGVPVCSSAGATHSTVAHSNSNTTRSQSLGNHCRLWQTTRWMNLCHSPTRS